MNDANFLALKALHELNRSRLEELELWRESIGELISDQVAEIASLKIIIASVLAERAREAGHIEEVNAIAVSAIERFDNPRLEEQMISICEEVTSLAASIAIISD